MLTFVYDIRKDWNYKRLDFIEWEPANVWSTNGRNDGYFIDFGVGPVYPCVVIGTLSQTK